ncbi:MAG: hypothetical protein PF961_22820, partial [Planctomycetota bacterium]|nr:hypothetical protein [Planctomycetota bacterium]
AAHLSIALSAAGHQPQAADLALLVAGTCASTGDRRQARRLHLLAVPALRRCGRRGEALGIACRHASLSGLLQALTP